MMRLSGRINIKQEFWDQVSRNPKGYCIQAVPHLGKFRVIEEGDVVKFDPPNITYQEWCCDPTGGKE